MKLKLKLDWCKLKLLFKLLCLIVTNQKEQKNLWIPEISQYKN